MKSCADMRATRAEGDGYARQAVESYPCGIDLIEKLYEAKSL